jgi:hypothetical protein
MPRFWYTYNHKGHVATFEAAWAQMSRLLTHPDHFQDSAPVRVATLLTSEVEILWRALRRPGHSLPVLVQTGDTFNATL